MIKDKSFFVLIGITLLGVLFRYTFLGRPMGHDEAYTYMAFASRGMKTAITNYHLPNNHVLHTILVVISTQLFGNSPEAIRLPAFVAGIMLIPAVYLIAVKLFDQLVALTSSAIVAALPVLIDYSTTARGYSLVALFTLMLTLLFLYLLENHNLIAWIAIVLVASLGLYTIPIMVYPTGMLLTWYVIIELQRKKVNSGRVLLFTVCIGSSIVLLAGFLYSPILVHSGISSIIGNEVVESLSWDDFWQSLPVRVKNTWAEWNRGLPRWITYPEVVFLCLTFFYPGEKRFPRVSFWISGFIFISGILIIQRVAPWPRVWLFLLPLFVIWVTGGLIHLSYFVASMMQLEMKLPLITSWLIVGLILTGSSHRSFVQFTQKSDKKGETEEVAIFLKDYLKPDDLVVVTSPDAVVLRYYLLIHGVSKDYTEREADKPFDRAIVVVNTAFGQSMESVLERRSFLDELNPQNQEIIYRSSRFTLYPLQNP